jgi:hypothetical protein
VGPTCKGYFKHPLPAISSPRLHQAIRGGGVKHRCPGERRPASSAHGRGASSGDRLPARSVHGEDQAASGGEWLPARGEPRHWGTSGANSGAAATALAPPTGAHCGRRWRLPPIKEQAVVPWRAPLPGVGGGGLPARAVLRGERRWPDQWRRAPPRENWSRVLEVEDDLYIWVLHVSGGREGREGIS